jgi:hypothetical protein
MHALQTIADRFFGTRLSYRKMHVVDTAGVCQHLRSMGKRGAVVMMAVFVVGFLFRLLVVNSFQAPAGDGVQYFRISQELARSHRFAYGPPPAPLAYSRLPGYPLFLAFVAVRQAGIDIHKHLVRATIWNAILDLGTVVLLYLLLRERRMQWGVRLAAVIAAFSCPLLLLLCCYGLTEALATFLGTLEIYLVVRGLRTRLVLHAALAGGIAGLAQLVRLDAAALAPIVGLVILTAERPWTERLRAAGACGLTALAVFAPWPLRNVRQFGAAHLTASGWVAADGRPLPLGIYRWMQTWGTGTQAEEYFLFLVANNAWLDPTRPAVLLPQMYDSAEERAEVVSVIRQYNQERLSSAVDARFTKLAIKRRRAWFRTFVTLPLRRLALLWAPLPAGDFPMRTALLGLPRWRAAFGWWDRICFTLAVIGAARLGKTDRRALVLVATAIVSRCILHVYSHPFPVQRYLAEIYPLLIGVAAVGVMAVGAAGANLLRWRSAITEPKSA